MTSQMIGVTETGWFNPGVNPPPFDMKLLLMVAGLRTDDSRHTSEAYTEVLTAYVQKTGPNDYYSDITQFDELISDGGKAFLAYRFELKNEDGFVFDWCSDSIVAWAYYPIGIVQTAVAVKNSRQAAAMA